MKTLKKIYNLLPFFMKERAKEIYYNLKHKEKFSREGKTYKTLFTNEIEVIGTKPMYSIARDIENYETFYKIKKGDCVIDAGANEGIISLFYSKKVAEEGKVFSFEPDIINQSSIKENMKLNRLDDNIFLNNNLLWNENKELEFFESGTVASSIFYEPRNSRKILKKAITIDGFCEEKKIQKLDFIKMDIEGAEVEAIEGALETILKFKPNFAIASYHLIKGERTFVKLEEFFRKHNYPYKTITFKNGEIITFAGYNLV